MRTAAGTVVKSIYNNTYECLTDTSRYRDKNVRDNSLDATEVITHDVVRIAACKYVLDGSFSFHVSRREITLKHTTAQLISRTGFAFLCRYKRWTLLKIIRQRNVSLSGGKRI